MSYELIETVEVGSGGASSIEFTSIPQDGTDLVVKFSGRTTSGGNRADLELNGSTANFTRLRLTGTGSNVATGSHTNSIFQGISRASDTANTFGNTSIYISNYTSSNAKSISVDGTSENNASDAIQHLTAFEWDSTSAITSVGILGGGATIVEYSSASLYKITAA